MSMMSASVLTYDPYYCDVVWFDGAAGPGWYDYVGLVLTVVGFGIAIVQLQKTRGATKLATDALQKAQHDLSRLAFMSVIPQVQMVVEDLGYALPNNDGEVARRALVRFGMLSREASGILTGIDGDHGELRKRLERIASKATRTKGTLATEPSPDVVAIVKTVSGDIDLLLQELLQLGAQMRNRIEGVTDV